MYLDLTESLYLAVAGVSSLKRSKLYRLSFSLVKVLRRADFWLLVNLRVEGLDDIDVLSANSFPNR